jgi:DNA-binding response OmpR family regulator
MDRCVEVIVGKGWDVDAPIVLLIEAAGTWRTSIETDLRGSGLLLECDDLVAAEVIVRHKASYSAFIVGPSLSTADQIRMCRLIRSVSQAPIVAVSTKTDDAEELRMLSAGATEFFTVPLRTAVFLARLTGRTHDFEHSQGTNVRSFANVELELDARVVKVDGETIALTKTEFDILSFMSISPRKTFSRRELAEAVWPESWFRDDHRIEAHMSRLRRKINQHGEGSLLIAIRGVGYRLLSTPRSNV